MRKQALATDVRTSEELAVAVANGIHPAIETHPVDNSPDARFFWLLTEPNQERPMVIWNFPIVRSQGIAACQREDAGETPYQATKDLQYPNGPYTFDDANSITSAAETIYCPWHNASVSAPDWANTSAPVYPAPVYSRGAS